MNNDLRITLPDGTQHLRTGDLAPEVQRAGYRFDGNIKAPFNYFKVKYGLSSNELAEPEGGALTPFQKFDMVVEVDRLAYIITYREDNHTNKATAIVTGKLTIPTEIKKLGINTEKKYNSKDLGDLLKMNRLLFSDKDDSMRLVAALRDFKAKVEADIATADDKKGNKTSAYTQKIDQPHDLRFNLTWPVISGEDPVKFEVEINYDVRAQAIEFWLESVEMHEAILDASTKLVNAEIEKFQEAGLTIVEQ
jgi:hypothetical protein